MDLTEAEDIQKRWQEYTKNYTKKIFMTQITTMVSHHSPRVRHAGMQCQGWPLEASLQTKLVGVMEL